MRRKVGFNVFRTAKGEGFADVIYKKFSQGSLESWLG